MPSARFYNWLYRVGAPWGSSPRPVLVEAVESGRLTARAFPRALDLGCGEGPDSLFLADRGFDVVGVDFSGRALAVARRRAKERGLDGRVRFVECDLTKPELPGVEGPFDLLFDGGSLDDLQGANREAAVRHVHRLSRPGSKFLMWCFFGARNELPWISFVGPSRVGPGFEPGEVERLFGGPFEIQRLDVEPHRGRWASFLMTRR